MPKPRKSSSQPVDEHIFAASRLTPLAVRWKELTAAGRHKEAMQLLEEIVIGSTQMFERLAQYEDYHLTVELPALVSAAQEKVVKWLLKWQPKKGRLFSWFSKCAKNAFRSELVKMNQYRKRVHVTSDSLEKFYGVEDHAVDKLDAAADFRNRLLGITCRWGDPQEIGAIRFLIDCIIDDDHDKQASIRTAAYAYGISFELSKFFYAWSVTALRHAMHDKVYIPFTDQDLFRAMFAYDPIIELLDFMSWDNFKRYVTVHGGTRLKVPTLNQLTKQREDYELHRAVGNSDQDPDAVVEVARKFKKSPRSAQEIFNEMVTNLDPKRYGEHEVYGDEHA